MVNSLWFKWKGLRLPWRKSFLVGSDLKGNTFWEFKDVANASKFRRIVKFDPKTHFGDVQVSPQWHQWLRHVREHPPSIEEQQQDLVRQAQIKQLARLADERWASKPSFLDKPQTQQPSPATNATDATLNRPAEEAAKGATSTQTASASATAAGMDTAPKPGETRSETKPASTEETAKKEDPWAKASNPGDNWQPESWKPTSQR
ncbi:NADH:ubiquinone oxidoreductase 17.2kDa subunit [Penicillium riverlandense]|uniref:NADH:ubiquinone oxidoreductase 17.2kDa subunit n=1 Tax=Penicillium riverlandense TaxID=1903569 RepID=UPI0025494346|nr:NADH:ubiquinone oxidoreductase 17.2kDa subunit [Penicillium riverlandense]KAJ5814819.1 NADH:ubiquinone oxidoreductase 17.2kDa subunit [Penicillium riverlandense]